MIINGLDFRKTCECSPEQYDVFDSSGAQVGYVRLRWGGLRCEYPCVGGEEIYWANVGDNWTGSFRSEQERMYHLKMIANKILARIGRKRTDMDEDDRREAIGRIMRCLGDGYVDFSGWADADELAIIREAMELLIATGGAVVDD